MTLRPHAWLAAALVLAALPAHAINKCVDKTGKITYQEGRCPDDAKQNQVQILAPPDDAGAALPGKNDVGGADPEDSNMLNLVAVIVGYESCTKLQPDFATIHAQQYEEWRAANTKYLARLEHSARYQELLVQGRKENAAQPANSPEFLEQHERYCNVQFIPMLVRNSHR